jgi:two-component system, response regulator PdtaR
MESALIVSDSDKDTAFFSALLNAVSVNQITSLKTADDARKLVLKQDFDFIIVNAPLKDESGENFSRYTASKGVSQVLLLVENKIFDSVYSACEADGIMTISKPLDKTLFWSALLFAKSAQNRIKRIQAENTSLRRKIEDIRIIDRAKLLLISYMKMSEQESHRYIEKQAMDIRSTRRIVAEGILKRYDNYKEAEDRL